MVEENAEKSASSISFLHKQIMNLKEAALYMGLSSSMIYKMTMKRELPFSKPGGKLIYFRKCDLDDYMLGNPQKSKLQIASEAEHFLITKKHVS